ncbi:TetR/AcrR family transcriptional regulator [Cohnella thermotolerans]|jgi:AcrR family transcriptional regulator|uniref:TetR/AcrR family transcriptional regulator n=1 Tax=Cohnella thermotolerans TaxID=329858 RepID=UPI00040214B8|nr:TetR/AcrR family transcriptional regulator [Cohnella thermotolerans]
MSAASASFQKIMDTAEALIQEKDCRQMTLQDIIQRSGLSKGAIYHYVSGKDELLGLILKSRVERANKRFDEAVRDPGSSGMEKPLRSIAEGMLQATRYDNVTNKIFTYLLSQADQPKIAAVLDEVHEFTLRTCASWVETGQRSGYIPAEADGRKLAESLLTFMYGMRVQSTIKREAFRVTEDELIRFMSRTLS